MAVLVTDPDLETRLKAERRQTDSDVHDEVWEDLYVMAPLPNNEHQEIEGKFIAVLVDVVRLESPAQVTPGVNVSERDEDWQFNYRGQTSSISRTTPPAIAIRTGKAARISSWRFSASAILRARSSRSTGRSACGRPCTLTVSRGDSNSMDWVNLGKACGWSERPASAVPPSPAGCSRSRSNRFPAILAPDSRSRGLHPRTRPVRAIAG